MLDHFAFEVFLSVYIFSPSIARMPKFRLLTKRDPTLGYTREADEIFKKNSAKFPHSPIHHYTSIYGALLFSVSPVRCTCIIKYGAVRKFFQEFRAAGQVNALQLDF